MDRLKELNEAKTAAQEVIEKIDNSTSSLESSSSWGIFDIFFWGTYFKSCKKG